MTFEVELSDSAERKLRKLDRQVQRKLQAVIDLLAETPRPPKATQLRGLDDYWRVRVGDYRIVYSIDDGRLHILVITVGHRSTVYRRL